MLSVLFTGKSGPTKAQLRKKRQEDLGPRALSNKRYQKYFSEETFPFQNSMAEETCLCLPVPIDSTNHSTAFFIL